MTHSSHRLVTMRLPKDLISQIENSARAQDMAPAEIIRTALTDALMKGAASIPTRLTQRVAITRAFDLADGWLDLQTQLRALGFVLRHDPDGKLSLNEWPSNQHLCKLEEIGQSQTELTTRYRAPFPGLQPEAAHMPVFRSKRTSGMSSAA
ncbi:CopG family transcriptional regulator [Thioclava sp. SK-1]|uniref:ribbon-helix-helix domain-containing protein n=1 Tax=Thioclava sp. SK-1 TaxID=1889770 RepID=UPI00114C9648|nr:CopG family transcriptional regulator [Thioclava sp. SK-1]